MTMLEEIYEAARQAAPSGADEELVKKLCRAALAQLQARLKDGVQMDACRDAFVCAAAWTALAMLLTPGQAAGGSAESFTVGDVSVKAVHETAAATAEATAEGYLARAEALMRPFCRPRGFSFLGVRG